ncbi:glycosyltransferase family 2 protein [Kocuria tytonis]|uniref:Glycosyltransferase n=1 Tax=Kocuria tytonis TaxID=2054280 RepID=A0A495A0Y9_9MICC|nr:glycosyltransferase [Kocuria tytonis]RKQ33113.1 glycosyltransferase [Kocuria tytonis]
MPFLSVIMPAYRAETTIERAMRSTLRAMPRDSELVVSVDGPDAETERAARRVTDARVVVRSNPENVGTVACMRRALESTDSEFVAKMDADDLCMPWRFRVEMAAMRRADIVCGSGIRFGGGAVPRPSYPGSLTSQEVGLLLPFTNPLFHPSLLARRQTLLDANAYATASSAEDYVLWCDALLNGARVVKAAAPVIGYRLSPDQISGAPGYAQRVMTDPEVVRAYTAWAHASGRPWLVENGGAPFYPVATRSQLDATVAGMRPRNRAYARRQVMMNATVVESVPC